MEERRQHMEQFKDKLDDLVKQVERIVSHIISEFGGEDPITRHKSKGNLNEGMDSIRHSIEELKQLLIKQNGRITKLENWKSWVLGAACAGAGGGGFAFISIMMGWIKH